MILQQIIRKGPEELLTITSFKSAEELHWNKDALSTEDTTEEIIVIIKQKINIIFIYLIFS